MVVCHHNKVYEGYKLPEPGYLERDGVCIIWQPGRVILVEIAACPWPRVFATLEPGFEPKSHPAAD